MNPIFINSEQYEEAVIEKTNAISATNKRVQKLLKLQNDFVNSIEKKKERNTRKRKADECNGCPNARFGCNVCKLSDIGKRLKLAEDLHQSKINDLENFARNTQIAPVPVPAHVNDQNLNEDVKSENESPPIEIIHLNTPKSEASSSDSSEAIDTDDSNTTNSNNENDANTSYDDLVQRNLGQHESEDSENALDASFGMWMPNISDNEENSDADEYVDAAAADYANDLPARVCYCCDNLNYCLNEF